MPNHPPLVKLRAAIEQAGYRFDRFAQLLGQRPDYFNHQLAGRKAAREGLIERAAEILRVDPETLRETEEPAAA